MNLISDFVNRTIPISKEKFSLDLNPLTYWPWTLKAKVCDHKVQYRNQLDFIGVGYCHEISP